MAVCSKTDLPLAWTVETARAHETLSVAPLLDKLHALGIDPETAALDKGYDNNRVYADCSERGVSPVIPLRKTPDVVKGKDKSPYCEHGDWRFAGADHKRNATKWRCPRGCPSPGWYSAIMSRARTGKSGTSSMPARRPTLSSTRCAANSGR